MTVNQLVPAAQYLRMSTEHQQYSLENQASAIQVYAQAHGFEVICTYTDAARSGVVLKQRLGLRSLLRDVVARNHNYRAILVYDVSRWGRFQDTDESAHYEFLCKSAGVPVHYCAETFANDGTLPSLIMKALKRTMAGEYSRELGVKVVAGQKRLTMLGFKQGGAPGYGLRRMLVSPEGVPRQELARGERKSITTDRVILVPGPADEVQTVREIYRMLISEKRSTANIARRLNVARVPRPGWAKWTPFSIQSIVTNPKYAGCSVFGRTTSRLYSPLVKLPKSEWTIRPGAFEPIIDEDTLAQAQKAYAQRHYPRTGKELLDDLRRLYASEGKLSVNMINSAPDAASAGTFRNRFGSLRNAYKLIGYNHPDRFGHVDARIRTTSLRDGLIARIAKMFPTDVTVLQRSRRWRSRLQLANGLIVSVIVARYCKEVRRWIVYPVKDERTFTTVLARLDASNTSFRDFHVFPNMDHQNRFLLSLHGTWLNRGRRLSKLSRMLELIALVRIAQKSDPQKFH